MTQIIDLGKLRFHFAPVWLADTVYEMNDCVRYGGNVYCYTYALKEAGTLPTDTTHWALMVEGFSFQGTFDPTASYRIGQAVAHGAKMYVSIKDSTGVIPPDADHWNLLVDGVQFEGEYAPEKHYQRNDIVTYGGQAYIAKFDTTNNLPTDPTYFDKLVSGVSSRGVYNDATAYKPGEVVAYGAHLYINIHESIGVLPTNGDSWTRFQAGVKHAGIWADANKYLIGEIVSYGAGLYRAKSDVPLGTKPTVAAYWDVWMTGTSYLGLWSDKATYKPNDFVTEGSTLYRAKRDVAAGTLTTNATYWEVTTTGTNYRGDWSANTLWFKNDIVNRGGQSFIAASRHAGGQTFAADLADGKWVRYTGGIRWRGGYAAATEYVQGDLVTDGVSTFLATSEFTSSGNLIDDGDKWVMYARGQAAPLPLTLQKAAFAAVRDGEYLIDTSLGSFNITLPAAPSAGDKITFIDATDSFVRNPPVLLRNGKNIENSADDLQLNRSVRITAIYTSPTQGWKLY